MSLPSPPQGPGRLSAWSKRAAPFVTITIAAVLVYHWPALNPPASVIIGGVLVWLTTRRRA